MSLCIAVVGACPFPVPQGSQVFLRDTALSFKRRGHDVHLVVYGHGLGVDQSGLRVHRSRGIPLFRKTAAGPSPAKPLLDAMLCMTLRRIVREYPVDLVCAHNYEALLVALAVGKRPILYHAHNAMSDELPYYFRAQRMAERAGRWLDRQFPRRADCVIVPHPRLAGHLILRGCDHGKIQVVAPPLDVHLFEPCSIGVETPPVLYAGNLDTYQNLSLLFAAMTQVRQRLPEARLLIATAERAHIPGAEVVPIPGFDSLHRLLARDAVFAVPRVSWSGYPIKLLNAMAAGMAIVACKSAAYPIIHEHNGLIVQDNDAAAFAAALLLLMQNPKLRKELGRNARDTIAKDHKPEDIAERLETIALSLLDQQPGLR